MDAIVYVGHGSRFKEGNTQFSTFIQRVMKESHCSIQEIGFLEAATPTVFQGIEKAIVKGATSITVVPVLLFAANHYKRDIPNILQKIKLLYPHISFFLTEPLGVHSNMIKLVAKRIQQVKKEKNGAVLLIGRGSSDEEPTQKLKVIAKAVEDKMRVPVYVAFLAVGTPNMEEMLQTLTEKYETVYTVPYLLFTGLLLKKIETTVDSLYSNIVLCDCLHYDEYIKLTLLERMGNPVLYVK